MILISGIKLRKIEGIAIWPFVFVRTKKPSKSLLNHERIHLRQQLEMLIIPFYVWYIFEWFFKLLKYRNRQKAYFHISFEKEAYENEKDDEFLKKRLFWNFLRYF